jgi:alanine dehydrogenase
MGFLSASSSAQTPARSLTLGVVGTSRKPDEQRLAIHPMHFARIDPALRRRMFLQQGYASGFGISDDLIAAELGGFRSREQLLAECDVVVIPKPLPEDLEELPRGGTLWGWPHAVQDEEIAQLAIERQLTLIAWESMHHWSNDGGFRLHVFHMNNELAGYCSVLHALQLTGSTGAYGRPLRAAVISFGAAGRGAVRALLALGVHEVTVLTHRGIAAVADPIPAAQLVHYERDQGDSSRAIVGDDSGNRPIAEFLAEYDVIVNCILQDTDAPLMFVTADEAGLLRRGSLIVDVSCDRGMGFEWARPTSFAEPMFTVGSGVHYYAVDHSPSYLWNSATWEISEALLPFLHPLIGGRTAWEENETIRRAIEIREGQVLNRKILSFQSRSPEFPYPKRPQSADPVR